ncbi:hypothetical protein NDU88_005550 [Pleurodeles waltl]|uniref:Uncharacterized protein n=1 Tax=Pleurodeles waltl TaxID=8319 RepID=A0AAV7LPE7_PLEWA|nr:hypothetical protein NDU88_005550 [Pleurodeles waltl]
MRVAPTAEGHAKPHKSPLIAWHHPNSVRENGLKEARLCNQTISYFELNGVINVARSGENSGIGAVTRSFGV